jgi:hypothetical protein
MSEQHTLSRRQFFERAALLGAAVSSTGALLSACDSSGSGGSGTSKSGQSGSGNKGAELNCNPDDLSDSKKKTRKALKYVDKSPKPDKLCKNCSLYEKPDKPGTCGGCTSVPGPIHPDGYCTAYQPQKG